MEQMESITITNNLKSNIVIVVVKGENEHIINLKAKSKCPIGGGDQTPEAKLIDVDFKKLVITKE